MIGRYADDEEIIVGGYYEEECMCSLIAKEEKHGKLVWYSGVTDDNYISGEYIGERNEIY